MRSFRFALLCAIAVGLFTLRASADPAYVQSKAGGASSTASWTTPAFDTPPAPGDLLLLYVSYGVYNCTVNTPSGWTLSGATENWGSQYYLGGTLFQRIAQSGDTGAVALTSTAACDMSTIEVEVSGENQSSPTEGYVPGKASSTATLSIASGSPSVSDWPIAFFASRSTSATVTSFTNGWTQAKISATLPYSQAQYGPMTSSPVTASITWGSSGFQVGAVVLVQPAINTSHNGLASTHAGGPHQSIVVSSNQGPSIPQLGLWESYFGTATSDSMAHISPANLAKWGDDCQGYSATTAQPGGDSGGANILQCDHPYFYTNLGFMEPHTSGGTNVLPWTGNLTGTSCPSAYKSTDFAATTGTDAPDWSSNSSNNWGMYEGTIGSDADRIGGFYSGTLYAIFINLNSSSLRTSVNDAIHGCSYENYALDGYEGIFNDNGFIGLASANWVPWWGEGAYNQKINWGSVNGTPYVSFTCNGGLASAPTAFFNGGTYCSTSSQIDSKTIAQGNTTYPADTGTGTNLKSSYTAAFEGFAASLTHADGSAVDVQLNDAVNGYMVCQMLNYDPNVTAAIRESATSRGWGDGRLQNDSTIQSSIDVASEDYACGGGTFIIHDYFTGGDNVEYLNGSTLTTVTGAGKYGTPQSLLDERAHVYLMWLLWNDTHPEMIGSFTHACSASGSCGASFPSWTDVWPWDFAVPSGRTTPYPTEALSSNGQYCSTANALSYEGTGQPCATGGAHDTSICAAGTAPNCLFIANYAHFWVWDYSACPIPDQTQWNACAKDIGPFTVLYNLSGVTQTLSSSNLSSWIAQYGSLTRMLWPGCVPSSSAYNTTAGSPVYVGDDPSGTVAPSTINVCASGAGDVYNNGRMGSVPLSSILGTTLADGEAIGFTGEAP